MKFDFMRYSCIAIASISFASCSSLQGSIMRGTADKPVVLEQAVTRNTEVSGSAVITQDLLVPEGVTLSFLPGTIVTVIPSEGTRTDSQFITTETEIVVRGKLILEKTIIAPRGGTKGTWGGIISSTPDAHVTIWESTVSGAQFGLMMLAGTAQVTDSIFKDNETGIAATLGARVDLAGNIFRDNDTATAAWHTHNALKSPSDTFLHNGDGAITLTAVPVPVQHRSMLPFIPDTPPVTREYLGETALTEDTLWSGTVVIDGQISVPPEVTLTIEPGTHVLFTFRDTNRDGLGESWIIVQGTVKVLGEEDAWVLFDSDDKDAQPGSWDSLSIIASDSASNIISHAIFRRGVKAFHNHFSRTKLDNVVFEDNLRGIQFQESEGTVIDGAILRRNQSGARFRDSQVTLRNIVATDNLAGINFLRSKVTASDIIVTGSFAESFVSRESETTLTRAMVTGNVRGPRFKGDGEHVSVLETVVSGNLTEGISFNNVKGIVRGCSLTANGFTGLSVTNAEVTAYRNRIAGNGRYEVDNNGSTVIDARNNDWGSGSAPDPEMIYDGDDEGGIGKVMTSNPTSFNLLLPGMTPPGKDITGELLVVGDVITPPDMDLHLRPGTSVFFSEVPIDSLFDLRSDHPSFPYSELHVMGRFEAVGTMKEPITFAPAKRTMSELDNNLGPARAQWGSVNLTGGEGAVFENCYFFRAATGIHAREAGKVIVKDSVFTSNEVGLRFSRSDVRITNNVFELNNTGMRFHEDGGTVSGNLFDSNGTGIFVTDLPENVNISGNTFRGSSDYHIKLGIHVTEDVVVEGGALEIPEGMSIGELLFDREDDTDLGQVILIP